MFATPFSAPVSPRFASQVFGRFMSRSAPAAAHKPMAAPVGNDPGKEEDDLPDLAQRVRDVGEW
ncbi:hypothetical protein [Acidovorax sp.]|uniref:hypothetical protein n=1 Tax=Acidovorax sp. TaxID=1872122 RepID=UPI0025B8002F|nr:hypothetical protein [Acidovorax sp.]MBW8466376.1 hypothetical protein [Acidovorax sp.]